MKTNVLKMKRPTELLPFYSKCDLHLIVQQDEPQWTWIVANEKGRDALADTLDETPVDWDRYPPAPDFAAGWKSIELNLPAMVRDGHLKPKPINGYKYPPESSEAVALSLALDALEAKSGLVAILHDRNGKYGPVSVEKMGRLQ